VTAEKRKAAERREACLAARHDLDALQGGTPVYSLDEKGDRVYVDDSNRNAAIRGRKARHRRVLQLDVA